MSYFVSHTYQLLRYFTSLSSMNWWRRITVANMRKEKFETSIIVGKLSLEYLEPNLSVRVEQNNG